MDIEQLMNAHAVLTLGKDMVFRDYAQGAFRLRKIGAGQRLTLYIIPEVIQLISAFSAGQRGESVNRYAEAFARMPAHEQWATMLRSVVGWLLANSIGYERTQFKLLCEQNLAAVWRKAAYRNLLTGWETLTAATERKGLLEGLGHAVGFGDRWKNNNTAPRDSAAGDVLKASIVVFREGVDFSVENTVPQVFDYVQKLTQRRARRGVGPVAGLGDPLLGIRPERAKLLWRHGVPHVRRFVLETRRGAREQVAFQMLGHVQAGDHRRVAVERNVEGRDLSVDLAHSAAVEEADVLATDHLKEEEGDELLRALEDPRPVKLGVHLANLDRQHVVYRLGASEHEVHPHVHVRVVAARGQDVGFELAELQRRA